MANLLSFLLTSHSAPLKNETAQEVEKQLRAKLPGIGAKSAQRLAFHAPKTKLQKELDALMAPPPETLTQVQVPPSQRLAWLAAQAGLLALA